MAEPHLVEKKTTFSSFSHLLDARILRSLADMGFARPTLVQAKAIPLALENRDILARARTGSGKTAAYCLPVAQKILSAKSVGAFYVQKYLDVRLKKRFFHRFVKTLDLEDENRQATRALILVPTRELSEQVSAYLKRLLIYCDTDVSISNVASGTTTHLQRSIHSTS